MYAGDASAMHRRRLSVTNSASQIAGHITRMFAKLNDVWDEVDMDEEQRMSRVNKAYEHIRGLMDDLVNAEQDMAANVHTGIEENLREIDRIGEELGMPQFRHNLHPKSIALFKLSTKEHESRATVYEQRRAVQEHLFVRVSEACERLGVEATDILPNTALLVKDADLQRMEEQCEQMNNEVVNRRNRAEKVQERIRQKLVVVEGVPFTEEIVSILDQKFNDEKYAFTNEVMSVVDVADGQVDKVYNDWVSERQFELDEARERIIDLRRKCHMHEDTEVPAIFDPIKYGHSLKDIHFARDEVARLEQLHRERKEVYDALDKWRELWSKKVQYDEKENDPNKYKNRGGVLDQQLKDQNHLNKVELPRAAHALEQAVERYQMSHTAEPIVIDGLTPNKYITFVQDEYKHQKDMRKENRRAQRDQAGPSCGSPFRTPQPQKKVQQLAMRPATGLKANRALIFDLSTASVISPTRTVAHPKTSSPKSAAAAQGRINKLYKSPMTPSRATPSRHARK